MMVCSGGGGCDESKRESVFLLGLKQKCNFEQRLIFNREGGGDVDNCGCDGLGAGGGGWGAGLEEEPVGLRGRLGWRILRRW
jgi:hypothetical protein